MKKLVSVSAALLTFVLLLSVFPTGAEAQIYDSTLRLRVIANSDSEEDQRVKLLVRDAVIAYAEENYSQLGSREEAFAAVERDREILTALAEEVLAAEGYSYGASLWIGSETYGTRTYEDFSLPAGEYLSLQIRLGKAEGQNWWCVLFPPLCLGGALKDDPDDDSVPVGLTTDQYDLITSGQKQEGRYQVKFRILELLSELFGISGY